MSDHQMKLFVVFEIDDWIAIGYIWARSLEEAHLKVHPTKDQWILEVPTFEGT